MDEFSFVQSKIICGFENTIYSVEYQLKMDSKWLIKEFEIEYEVNKFKNTIRENNENGKLIRNFQLLILSTFR